ncbi:MULTISPECIES: hypothetical protein [Pandoraea]|uniref:Uncharacterized protein n=2 Tax=Pandoraea TaxID=93217 RepID=A0A5E4XKW2_9BURK|nr:MULTISPECIES: hypothetical protein [Pandoraea]VVE14005.1 hypothetical protein PCE31107_02792 [Pandoraea cepalis]VVE36934.1 hypothetical protein PTE31013_03976 [Pandoraea terrigena]
MRPNIGSCTALRSTCVFFVSGLVIGLNTAYAAPALDFGYRIDGPVHVRPTLVFNDGQDTYIQPSGNARTNVAGALSDGPYLRLPGTPESFTVRAGAITLHVQHAGLPSAPTAQAVNNSSPAGRADANSILRAVPGGYATGVTIAAGGNAADRPATPALTSPIVRVSARIDTDGKRPPVVGEPIVSQSVATTAISAAPASGAVPPVVVKEASPNISYLAKDFGADGIRDGSGGSIQIHFRARPTAAMQFASADGKHLGSSWDDSASVMTISAAPKFVVRDGQSSVIVSREIADTFHYPTHNAAGLEEVFSESGAVYLRVAEGTKKVTVRVDGKVVPGKQKGRYYRVSGAGDSFVVDADGFGVTVTRSRSVRFVDHEGSTS